MKKYRMNGEVLEGETAEDVVAEIRKGWFWKPPLEEMYAYAANLTKLPVKTADDFLAAMVTSGAIKRVEGGQK